MTARLADLTDDRFTAEQRAKLAEFDAAPVPPEVVVETVARALFDAANPIVSDFPDYWHRVTGGEETRDHYRRLAAAAIAALPPSPAEEAVKRVEALCDEYEQALLPIEPILLRAALASPAPAPQGEERLCLCGNPETDSVHHRPQTSVEEHAYEPAPSAAEFYGGVR